MDLIKWRVFIIKTKLGIREYVIFINNWVDSFEENLFEKFCEGRKNTRRGFW